jgi:hypothetical protein
MIKVKLKEIPLFDITLEPKNRVTRGSTNEKPPLLKGWVSIGGPISIPLNTEWVSHDKDLCHFLEVEENNFSFYLIHLACSFHTVKEEPFINAWLGVNLVRTDNNKQPQPIAWSMRPSRLVKVVKISRTIKVGGKLKLLKPSVEKKQEYEKQEIFLEALNELGSNPIWEFTKTKTEEIRGSHRLTLVVRIPKKSKILGNVSLEAIIQRKHWGVFKYKESFPDSPQRTFYLP